MSVRTVALSRLFPAAFAVLAATSAGLAQTSVPKSTTPATKPASPAPAAAAAQPVAPAPVAAPPTTTTATPAPTAPTWLARCVADRRQGPPDCSVEQRVVMANTGQLVALVTLRVPSDTNKPVMMVQVPLGLYIPGGVTIDVNGASSQRLDIQTCDANGCYAGMPVAEPVIAAMLKEPKLNVTMQGMNRQPVVVALPLADFAGAYARIK